MKILGKISIKNVTGGIIGDKDRMMKLLQGTKLDLMDVFGITKSFLVVEGKEGFEPSIKLKGEFKAVNLETGEVFRAGVCYLPKMASELIAGVLKGEGVSGDVQFGFRVSARYDESSATQYVYDVESLMEVAENDPLELLTKSLKQLPSSIKEPEAPKTDPVSEAPKTEPEPTPENEVRNQRKEKVKA